MSSEREENVAMAQLADQAERYEGVYLPLRTVSNVSNMTDSSLLFRHGRVHEEGCPIRG